MVTRPIWAWDANGCAHMCTHKPSYHYLAAMVTPLYMIYDICISIKNIYICVCVYMYVYIYIYMCVCFIYVYICIDKYIAHSYHQKDRNVIPCWNSDHYITFLTFGWWLESKSTAPEGPADCHCQFRVVLPACLLEKGAKKSPFWGIHHHISSFIISGW